MTFTTLKDGGLSVRIGGVEREADVTGLTWESTNLGDGGADFSLPVSDPYHPQAEYPELLHGAPVAVTHTLGGVTTKLYNGFVLTDPRSCYAGEVARVDVSCGGALEVAKGRSDMGFIFTDADTAQWFANKRSPKCYSFDNSGRVAITTADDVKVKHDVAGMIGAVAYNGATHLLGAMNGWKRITGTASWDLRDHMNAALLWWPAYKVGLDASDYHVIHQWSANSKAKNKPFDYVFGGASGAGYVALAMWSNKRGGTKTTDERFIELEDCVLYTDVVQKRVDQGMLAIAQLLGLSPGGYDTAPIGNLMKGLVVRPPTDPASALASLSAQADQLVEWGYFREVFRAKPMLTDPSAIRALPTCYRVDADDPDVTWEPRQHPEAGIARAVRLIYGHTAASIWPPGSPASVIAPADPGWRSGAPFMGVTSPVLTVDFASHNYPEKQARGIAEKLARNLGVALASGPVTITSPTVPVYGGGSRPAPYIHGADWIESEQHDAGPLYITRASVDADTGYVSLDAGLSPDLLIGQLEAAGSIRPVPLHKPHRKKG